MKRTLNENLPAYLKLYNKVRDDITEGVYAFGTKLPSKRTMAADAGVSTVTVEHAYALLADEGYVEARERSGYIVIFRTEDVFYTAANAERAVSVTAKRENSVAEFPFSVLTKVMRNVMNVYGHDILERSPNSGCDVLREAIAGYLARSRGIRADTEQIIIGSGAEYLYGLIVDVLGRDKVYAIEYPSYEKIEQVYRAESVKCEMLPLGNDGIESAALKETGADVLHITPYRSFPTGVTAGASKRHEYLRWADEDGRYIVEDDFESEFSVSKKPEETLFMHTAKDNVIYMNTFSKTVSTSLRVGYMVLPKHLVKLFEERAGFYSCTVPTFIQYVLAELISKGDFERHINRVRRQKRKESEKNKDTVK